MTSTRACARGGRGQYGGVVVFALGRSLWVASMAGGELIGLVRRATTALVPEGKVFVRGEYWNATADGDVGEGQAVEVTGVDGPLLRVRCANPT